jgi:hypothetical protein
MVPFWLYVGNTNGSGINVGNGSDNPVEIGGHVKVQKSSNVTSMTVLDAESGFNVKMLRANKNDLSFSVSSDTPNGKLLIMDIDAALIDVKDLNQLKVTFDGIPALQVDLVDVLQASGPSAMYHFERENGGYRLFLYIPHFSEHTVDVNEKVIENNTGGNDNTMAILIAAFAIGLVTITIVFVIIAFNVKRTRRTEDYDDFDLAGERLSMRRGRSVSRRRYSDDDDYDHREYRRSEREHRDSREEDNDRDYKPKDNDYWDDFL